MATQISELYAQIEHRLSHLEKLNESQGETLGRITSLIERFVAVETREKQREIEQRKIAEIAEQNQIELAEWRAYRRFFGWGISAVGAGVTLVLGFLVKGALGG